LYLELPSPTDSHHVSFLPFAPHYDRIPQVKSRKEQTDKEDHRVKHSQAGKCQNHGCSPTLRSAVAVNMLHVFNSVHLHKGHSVHKVHAQLCSSHQ